MNVDRPSYQRQDSIDARKVVVLEVNGQSRRIRADRIDLICLDRHPQRPWREEGLCDAEVALGGGYVTDEMKWRPVFPLEVGVETDSSSDLSKVLCIERPAPPAAYTPERLEKTMDQMFNLMSDLRHMVDSVEDFSIPESDLPPISRSLRRAVEHAKSCAEDSEADPHIRIKADQTVLTSLNKIIATLSDMYRGFVVIGATMARAGADIDLRIRRLGADILLKRMDLESRERMRSENLRLAEMLNRMPRDQIAALQALLAVPDPVHSVECRT